MKNNIPILKNWKVIYKYSERFVDPYYPDNTKKPLLAGDIYNDSRFPDGTFVITSRVTSSKGRIVETKNTKYKLGNIDKHYRKWLKDNKYNYNGKNPIGDNICLTKI